MHLIGPFSQLLTMDHMPMKGPLSDTDLHIIPQGSVLIRQGEIQAVGDFETLRTTYPQAQIQYLEQQAVGMPGMIDAHTHICYAGTRAQDYSMRIGGKSYLEIAKEGGGIWRSVKATRAAKQEELTQHILRRASRMIHQGITTIEVKSGYGLSVEAEVKMLRAIQEAQKSHPLFIPTCLAAHIPPKDYPGSPLAYLQYIEKELWPLIREENLSSRMDIFVEEGAFSIPDARTYLIAARKAGFDLTLHVDQFHPGSSLLAVELQVASADHLEASGDREIQALAQSEVVAVALPGASLGLGDRFTPARKLLDAGASVAIASDWNPGSAPMGQLLLQAALLSVYEKLSSAEILAGLTVRAAHALKLHDRGRLAQGSRADLIAFPTPDYREILYHQGSLLPHKIWLEGTFFHS
ncbi:MAG: imidazolonepropionase [Bacteroidota bacterium]